VSGYIAVSRLLHPSILFRHDYRSLIGPVGWQCGCGHWHGPTLLHYWFGTHGLGLVYVIDPGVCRLRLGLSRHSTLFGDTKPIESNPKTSLDRSVRVEDRHAMPRASEIKRNLVTIIWFIDVHMDRKQSDPDPVLTKYETHCDGDNTTALRTVVARYSNYY
jgi:hypothetical protein